MSLATEPPRYLVICDCLEWLMVLTLEEYCYHIILIRCGNTYTRPIWPQFLLQLEDQGLFKWKEVFSIVPRHLQTSWALDILIASKTILRIETIQDKTSKPLSLCSANRHQEASERFLIINNHQRQHPSRLHESLISSRGS